MRAGHAARGISVVVRVTWASLPSPVKAVEPQMYVSRRHAAPQMTNLEPALLSATGEIVSVPHVITTAVAPRDRARG